ncbi:MAG: hypothetical protein K2J20_01070 [Bacilli bacterium]|nr:hypothetical protein [Bacilli bacterium]
MVKNIKCLQTNDVNSEYEALFSVIHPILTGLALSLKQDIVEQVAGYEKISLELFTRLYEPGDGDCGICFEYAVHDAIVNKNPDVLNRIDSALSKYCKIKGDTPSSILFGAEKSGQLHFIDSVKEHLTDDSQLLTGDRGKPIKLKKHIDGVVSAFKKPQDRAKLPDSINGLWKADLFVGNTLMDNWVGTTVKINPSQLESARGLRLGIVPCKQGRNDKIEKHETKNLIVCPVPYDKSFMEIFLEGFNIVKQFILAHGEMPSEMNLPSSLDRLVCKELVARRKFPILGVIEVLKGMGQPHLMNVETKETTIDSKDAGDLKINRIVTPVSLMN